MKLIKFDLPINGTKVKNLEELRDNLTDEILTLARSSQLERWLKTRQLPEKAQAVATAVRSEGTDKGLFLVLCKVLEVEVHPDDVKVIFDAPPAPGNSIHKARYFEMYEVLKNRFEQEESARKKYFEMYETIKRRLEKEEDARRKTRSAANFHAGREQLLNSLQLLQFRFDAELVKARINEKYFDVIFQGFMNRLSAHLSNARKRLPDANPLKQKVLGFIELMDKTRTEWYGKVAGREKGVKFREGFEDSLLVFINGKVKSGKSSLGNYMAWGHTDPDQTWKQQVAPHLVASYFSHENNAVDGGDAKDEARQQREFRVGATEATSSIQGFRLPGLTWVDSPGMHSVKKENEKLARDYVEHADLILYTMKSDAPGRTSDLAEIQRLLGKDKKVLLLLTGSDDVEEDFDDETDNLVQTVVMKDAKRREKQHAYVREALRELANGSGDSRISNLEIISISARYAQLNADDPAAFAESGMGLLFETLQRIAQSDEIRIKQRKKTVNLHNFLQGCRDDLRFCDQLLSGFRQVNGQLNALRLLSLAHEAGHLIEILTLEFSHFDDQLQRMFEITLDA